jgi:putative DNA primase/helicase
MENPIKRNIVTATELLRPEPRATSDVGNAERLIANRGDDLRYCSQLGGWLYWDGKRWRQDDSLQVDRWAKDTVRAIYTEAVAEDDPDKRHKVAAWAIQSESAHRIEAMMHLARSHVPASPDDFDADPWLLNVENGTLDLRTGELGPHRRGDMLTKLAPTEYRPEAEAPTWTAFLDRIMGGDAELIAFLQRAVGYSLTGLTGEECLFIAFGRGRNGKSKFLGAIQDTLGRDYAQQVPSETLMQKRGDRGATPGLARLKGARFAATVETGEGGRLDEAVVKQATGGDLISARYLYGNYFEFKPSHKIWLATNHKPTVRGTDEGIWSRIKLIPFEVTIPEAERDDKLAEKLAAEAEGILAWAIQGYVAWQRERLAVPEIVRRATQGYREAMDAIGSFIDEECVTGDEFEVAASELYAAYKEWAKLNEEYTYSQRRFGDALTERGYEVGKITSGPNKGRKLRKGIGLKNGYSLYDRTWQ